MSRALFHLVVGLAHLLPALRAGRLAPLELFARHAILAILRYPVSSRLGGVLLDAKINEVTSYEVELLDLIPDILVSGSERSEPEPQVVVSRNFMRPFGPQLG